MPTGSATLNAVTKTQPIRAFNVNAEVVAPDLPTTFIGRGGRNRHDRGNMHFGTESADLVQIEDAVGDMPAGSTLQATLRYLWDLTAFHEAFWGDTFVIDAEVDEDVWWRDTFYRTEVVDLGRSTSRSTFGATDWQRYDTDGGLEVSVDGAEAVFVDSGPGQHAQFVGYPAFSEGVVKFSFYAALDDTTDWLAWIQPYRDDLTDVAVYIRLRYILGNYFFDAGFMTPNEDTILTVTHGVLAGNWYTAKFLLGLPGGSIAVELFPADDDEPDFDSFGTLPASNTGHRWLIMGGAGKFSYSDDALAWTNDDTGSQNYSDVCYGDAFGVPTWMAVGSMLGTAYSRDAETWTFETTDHHFTPSFMPTLYKCATDGAGTWIAFNISSAAPWRLVGDPATSFWNAQTALNSGFRFVRWGNGLFLAGSQNNGSVHTSPTGVTWTERTVFDTSTDWAQDAVFGNEWVVVGGGGSGFDETRVGISADGLTWDLYTIDELFEYFAAAVAFGEGVYALVANAYSDNGAVVATSTDGINWTLNDLGITTTLTDIAYVDGHWVLTGNSGLVMEADDPAGTWTSQTSGFGSDQVVTALGRPAISSREAPTFRVANDDDDLHVPLLLDHIRFYKTDSDPARRYYVFRIDAEVRGPFFTIDAFVAKQFTIDGWVFATRTGSLTLNGIVKVSESGSFTIDAEVSAGFTIDASVFATVSSSFTIDAYVPGAETGEYGDFTLGDHELGGD